MAGTDTTALSPKQEAFAQAFVECNNASEAYRRAYTVRPGTKAQTIHVNASKIMADAKVAQRIDELQAAHLERHNLTIDDISAMLQEDRKLARELNTPAAAVSASMGLAKLYGHLTEKQQVMGTGPNGGHIVYHNIQLVGVAPK